MTGSPTPERYVGRIRDEQGWIGGTNPFDAHLVTPPADRLGALLDDLLAWVNRDDVDPIAQAAIAHAQFEIIHPFADGNGRIGRVLDRVAPRPPARAPRPAARQRGDRGRRRWLRRGTRPLPTRRPPRLGALVRRGGQRRWPQAALSSWRRSTTSDASGTRA